MYLELEEGKGILSKENLWYDGDTSAIYKKDNFLYKIYKKKEPHKRSVLDILLNIDNIRDIGVLPIRKIKTNLNNYGMVMRYIPDSVTFRYLLKNCNVSTDDFIKIIIELSDNLKIINNEGIHFSDLHHNNILVLPSLKTLYIDFDDAVVKNYNSTHICVIAYDMHDVKTKDDRYKDDLIKYGNLDQESLCIMLFDYLMGIYIERPKYNFEAILNLLDDYFPDELVNAVKTLKNSNTIVQSYPYYIGDFLKSEDIKESCKKLRRDMRAYYHISNNK